MTEADRESDSLESRVDAIRGWCRGRGLLGRDSDITPTPEELALFGASDATELRALLERGLHLLTSDARQVLWSALGGDELVKGDTLGRRRINYESLYNVSPRTILRHETAAARRLAEVCTRLNMGVAHSATLSERVADLELVVQHLLDLVAELLTQARSGKKLNGDDLLIAFNGLAAAGRMHPDHFGDLLKRVGKQYETDVREAKILR